MDFLDVDYSGVAKSLAATGERVRDPAALRQALERGFASGQVYLIDACIDPEPSVWLKPF